MSSNEESLSTAKRSSVATRLLSAATLCSVLGGMGFVGHTIYRVATDEFVAPCVLSPDSDLVIQSKLSMAQLVAERFRVVTRVEEIDTTVQASDEAIKELKALRESAARGLDYTAALTSKQASAGTADLKTLAHQRAELAEMLKAQEDFVEQMHKDLDAGLVAKSDYSREVQTLNQLKIGILENDRSELVSEVQMSQVALTQRAIRDNAPGHIATPEMLMLQDQIVRVTTDLLKLQAERRSAIAERIHLNEELRMIDELTGQLKSRPTFIAAEQSVNVAFVPYTQIEGVESGAPIFDCVWGVFACKEVGHITKLLPGEVILPDPWGTPTRGQYATMDLTNDSSGRSKTLRIRPATHAIAAVTTKNDTAYAKNK